MSNIDPTTDFTFSEEEFRTLLFCPGEPNAEFLAALKRQLQAEFIAGGDETIKNLSVAYNKACNSFDDIVSEEAPAGISFNDYCQKLLERKLNALARRYDRALGEMKPYFLSVMLENTMVYGSPGGGRTAI